MNRQQFTISDVKGTSGQEALDSYNAKLLDSKREFGTPITDSPMAKPVATVIETEAVEKAARPAKKVKAIVSSVVDQKRGWKTILAAQTISKAGPDVGKSEMLTILMDTLNISKANANVYYTKIQARKGK
jgi:hypothetical protein